MQSTAANLGNGLQRDLVDLDILRDESRATGRKLIDVAAAVVDSYLLLPKLPAAT